MSDVSIKSKQVNAQSATQINGSDTRIGNALGNGNVGESTVAKSIQSGLTEDLNKSKRTQEDVDKIINNIIKGTGLTLDAAKKLLSELGKLDESSLLTLDSNLLIKTLTCLKYAIEDCTINGKLDEEKLNKVFNCYVFLTIHSDKKKMSCDEARKNMQMSFIQFIKLHDENLKNKSNITAQDVKNSLKKFITKSFTKEKLEQMKKAPQEAKNAIKVLFGMRLENCGKEERNLLLEAFVMLLQDEDMVEYTPVLIGEVCNNLKKQPEKLQEFLTKDLREILTRLGFKPQTIDKLIQLGLIDNINEDNVDDFLNSGLKFLQSIEPEKLPVLLDALDVYMSGGELSKEQADVLLQHKEQLNILIGVIAGIANNPDILKGHEELFKNLQKKLETSGLDKYVFKSTQGLFEQYSEHFTGVTSKDDFIKELNELTGNKYGEVIGDTNPENLSKNNNLVETTETGIGLPQRVSQETFAQTAENLPTLRAQVVEEKIELPKIVKTEKSNEQSQQLSTIKSQAIKSAEAFNIALSKHLIKIEDAGKDFNNACKSVQLKVLSYLKRQKNNRLDLINSWHNSQLASIAANKFNFNSEQIEELDISIGRKQVLKHDYEQKHKNEEETIENA